MLSVPNLILIGGNSRNSGKTTMACKIISKLSVSQEVIGLKVTAVQPGENHLHGTHQMEEETSGGFIFEEFNSASHKDTSMMLRAGASRVFYIKIQDKFIEDSVLHFLSRYINKQIIVCESRILRKSVKPGMFLMMMRLVEDGKIKKDIADFVSWADKVFNYTDDQIEMDQFVEKLHVMDGKFVFID